MDLFVSPHIANHKSYCDNAIMRPILCDKGKNLWKRTEIPKIAFFICKKSVDKKTVRTTLGLVTD